MVLLFFSAVAVHWAGVLSQVFASSTFASKLSCFSLLLLKLSLLVVCFILCASDLSVNVSGVSVDFCDFALQDFDLFTEVVDVDCSVVNVVELIFEMLVICLKYFNNLCSFFELVSQIIDFFFDLIKLTLKFLHFSLFSLVISLQPNNSFLNWHTLSSLSLELLLELK